jgi:hypothetical protein
MDEYMTIICNIDKSDRTNRAVIGVILLLGALFGLSKIFVVLLGLILIVEGAVGWSIVPVAIEKIQSLQPKK